MRRVAVLAVFVAVMVLTGAVGDASAQLDDGGPTPAPTPVPDSGGGFGGTVEVEETASGVDVVGEATRADTDPPAVPVVAAAQMDSSGLGALSFDPAAAEAADVDSDGGGDAGVSDDGGGGRECVEPRSYVTESGTLVAYCARYATRLCGSERIDDVVSGEINNEPPGHYAAFLSETVGYLDDGSFSTVPGFDDVSSVNELLNVNGLTDPERRDEIPVFNFCGRSIDDVTIETYDFTSISFDWTLGATEVYDVDGIRRDLYEKLVARLRLEDPQIGAVPDTDTTIVQFPTWLYLRNLLVEEAVYTTNDTDTFRVDLRAQIVRLDWFHDGELIESCTAAEVKVWDPDIHNVIDDLSDCHYVFTQKATADLTVEIVYRIEEDVRTAVSSGAYLPLQWSDYFGVETLVDLDGLLPDYRVCEIYSVNVSTDLDRAAAQAIYDNTACTTAP